MLGGGGGGVDVHRREHVHSRIHGLLRYSVWKNAGCGRRDQRVRVLVQQIGTQLRDRGSMYMGRAPFPYSSRSSLHSSILPLSDCGCGGISLPSGVFRAEAVDRPHLLPRHGVEAGAEVAGLAHSSSPVSYFGAFFTVAISTPVTLMRSRNSSLRSSAAAEASPDPSPCSRRTRTVLPVHVHAHVFGEPEADVHVVAALAQRLVERLADKVRVTGRIAVAGVRH